MNRTYFLLGFFSITAAYHFLLFLFYRRNFPPLCFGLINLLAVVFNLGKILRFAFAPKLATLVFIINPMLFLLFMISLFPEEFYRWVHVVILSLGSVYVLIVLMLPLNAIVERGATVNSIIAVFMLIITVYIDVGLIKALLHKKWDAVPLFIGFFMISSFAIFRTYLSPDLLTVTSVIGPVAITVLYSATLARKSSAAFFSSEKLVAERTEELQKTLEMLEKKNADLQTALANIKTLQGCIPICANCKKIRNDDGFWQQVENYISDHSEAKFSHSVCPECYKKLYGGADLD